MASTWFHCLRRASRFTVLLLKSSLLTPDCPVLSWQSFRPLWFPNPSRPSRNFSHGTVNLVISQGKPRFEVQKADPPKKEKWLTKKRLKMQRLKEKNKRKEANRKDPRRLTVKRKKQKFASVEDRIKDKLQKARIKEASLVERLKRYEVPKVQGPVVQPHKLTGEEKFYFKKMAQKRSNYVPVGRRGVFGGVILNMHMHWKKHETVKVFFKPCKPGQIQEYVQELERLSGGIAIQIIGDDTAIFYRGKNYVQPKVMSPIDTLSKKRALEKSKYEQSLETVRHFVAIAEKELELYYRHIALYGNSNKPTNDAVAQTSIDPNDSVNQHFTKSQELESTFDSTCNPQMDYDSSDQDFNGTENESSCDLEQDDDFMPDYGGDLDAEDKGSFSKT